MEKEELKRLLIVDSEYYDPNASYVSFFKNYNIKTIGTETHIIIKNM